MSIDAKADQTTLHNRGLMRVLLDVRDDERGVLTWSILYSFCVFASYYLLRPLREEIGADQPANISQLWTGTFFVMLVAAPIYAAVASRLNRIHLIGVVYCFFILNMLILFLAVTYGPVEWRNWIDRIFYIWLSVFNLFVIASLWSFMADIYRVAPAKRLFGLIAAGGTLGAIAGSAAAVQLPKIIPPFSMILLAALLLEAAVWAAFALHHHDLKRRTAAEDRAEARIDSSEPSPVPVGGKGRLAGIVVIFRSPYLLGICLYLLIYTMTASFLYVQQSHIVNAAVTDRAERTSLFAGINLIVNCLALIMQFFFTGRIIRCIGVGWTLTILPLLCALGFVALGFALGGGDIEKATVPISSILGVVVIFQIIRSAGNYALAKPAREVLFTVVNRRQKYESKGFIDTVVYRGGDVASAWVFTALDTTAGFTLGATAFIAAPLSILWALVGLRLGRAQARRANRQYGAAR